MWSERDQSILRVRLTVFYLVALTLKPTPTPTPHPQLNDDDAHEQVDIFIDPFCLDSLPKIHHLIRRVKVWSTSMERILLAADYPNLSQLDIFMSHEEPILPFNGEWTLSFFIRQMMCSWTRSHFSSALSKDSHSSPYSWEIKQKEHQWSTPSLVDPSRSSSIGDSRPCSACKCSLFLSVSIMRTCLLVCISSHQFVGKHLQQWWENLDRRSLMVLLRCFSQTMNLMFRNK